MFYICWGNSPLLWWQLQLGPGSRSPGCDHLVLNAGARSRPARAQKQEDRVWIEESHWICGPKHIWRKGRSWWVKKKWKQFLVRSISQCVQGQGRKWGDHLARSVGWSYQWWKASGRALFPPVPLRVTTMTKSMWADIKKQLRFPTDTNIRTLWDHSVLWSTSSSHGSRASRRHMRGRSHGT